MTDQQPQRVSRREARRLERERVNALARATNGEHIPRQEREALGLPDWTA